MSARFLFVNQSYLPDVTATGQYLGDVAEQLVRMGHRVAVVAGRQAYNREGVLHPRRDCIEGVEVIRVGFFALKRYRPIIRVIDALITNAAMVLRALFVPCDCLVVLTTPPLLIWTMFVVGKLKRVPVVHWVMDVNPDQGIQTGWVRPHSLAARALQRLNGLVLRHLKKIIVLDLFMKELLQRNGADPAAISVFPLWSDAETFMPIDDEDNPFRKENDLSGKFVVVYSGNLSICHPLKTALDAARDLQEEGDILFLFIGGGPRTREVLDYKEKFEVTNISLLPYQERSALRFSLSVADLHLVSMGDPYVGIVHPSKIYTILMLGKPVLYIGPAQSSVSNLLCPEGMHYSLRHGDAQGVVSAILTERKLTADERKKRSQKIREYALQYDRKVACTEMAQELIAGL